MKKNQNNEMAATAARQRFAFDITLFTSVLALSVQAAIIPPDKTVAGKSQAEWNGLAWKWIAEIPWDSSHPWRDRTGANVLRYQSGPVWFLPPANTTQPVTRFISVPDDEILHFALAGSECSNVEDPPFYGSNEEEMRACAQSHPFVTSCEVDGVSLTNLASYVTTSPLFDFVLPPVNSFGVVGGGPGQGVAHGANIMIQFSPGSHTVHSQSAYPQDGFSNEITYQITVYQRPALNIQRGDPSDVLSLSWPFTPGFSLLEATNLTNTLWSAPSILSSNVTNGTQFVTVTNAAGNRFFRLYRP